MSGDGWPRERTWGPGWFLAVAIGTWLLALLNALLLLGVPDDGGPSWLRVVTTLGWTALAIYWTRRYRRARAGNVG